jgi:hypothetical protein
VRDVRMLIAALIVPSFLVATLATIAWLLLRL